MFPYSQPGKLRLREGSAGQANRLDQQRPTQRSGRNWLLSRNYPRPLLHLQSWPRLTASESAHRGLSVAILVTPSPGIYIKHTYSYGPGQDGCFPGG